MTRRIKPPSRTRMRQRTRTLRRTISDMDFVASGTLHTRTKVCGRKNCRCADDPAARHGPYYEWSRHHDGRLRHSIVTPEQAQLFTQAIANYQHLKALLRRWEHETATEILNPDASKERLNRKK
ncbi:MAG: DUF6788 family protein [Gammaproteobacteria bacterium]